MISDRQLRPRRHLETQSEISQRGDDERKTRSVRAFRIESDPVLFPQDSREALADLVRHMHPYCIRTHLEKDTRVSVDEEEEEFVDVEGYEEQDENILDQSGRDLNQKACQKENITYADQNIKTTSKRSALVTTSDAGRVKKTVTFALNLISVHEIPPDDEDIPESTSSKNDITSSEKPKALSLDQYRLLRQKKRPLEENRIDFRTKWPSLPELPPILPDLFAPNTASVKVKTSPSQISRKDARKAVDLCIDPPNPVLVPLKPTGHINPASEPLGSDSDACVSCEEVRDSEVKPEASERRRPSVLMPATITEQQNQTTCGEIGERSK